MPRAGARIYSFWDGGGRNCFTSAANQFEVASDLRPPFPVAVSRVSLFAVLYSHADEDGSSPSVGLARNLAIGFYHRRRVRHAMRRTWQELSPQALVAIASAEALPASSPLAGFLSLHPPNHLPGLHPGSTNADPSRTVSNSSSSSGAPILPVPWWDKNSLHGVTGGPGSGWCGPHAMMRGAPPPALWLRSFSTGSMSKITTRRRPGSRGGSGGRSSGGSGGGEGRGSGGGDGVADVHDGPPTKQALQAVYHAACVQELVAAARLPGMANPKVALQTVLQVRGLAT